MDKQKNVMFGTSLNGYKKQDVNAFIASLNANFSAAEDGYRREIAALKDELNTLRVAKEESGAREAELAALREEVAALKAELAAVPEKSSDAVDSDEVAELRKKAALYDRMSSQLGDMMISANHNADIILGEARKEAEQSLDSAKTTIAQSAALLSGQLDTLYRGANTRAFSEINAAMQQTQRAINKLLEDLSARRARIEEMLRQTDTETRRAADEQINKMFDCTKDTIAAIGAKAVGEETDA